MAELVDAQELMERLEKAKYRDNVLKHEVVEIRSFANGYNRCIDHLQLVLIRENDARPLTPKEIKELLETK